jgi:hypothetical protein
MCSPNAEATHRKRSQLGLCALTEPNLGRSPRVFVIDGSAYSTLNNDGDVVSVQGAVIRRDICKEIT